MERADVLVDPAAGLGAEIPDVRAVAAGDAPDDLSRVARLSVLFERASSWTRPVMPVKGADLVASGVPAGPEIGEKLAKLEDAWLSSNFRLTREELLATLSP